MIKRTITVTILTYVFILSTASISAQSCPSLQDATSDQLISYLDLNAVDRSNEVCMTFAIRKLGADRAHAAIDILATLLDFKRPPTAREKAGVYIRIQTVDEIYPAAGALEEIGEKALPSVLKTIKSSSTSAIARENALFVWMEIQKSDSPRAILHLERELESTHERDCKQNLRWALSHAPNLCNPPDKEQCDLAARKEQ